MLVEDLPIENIKLNKGLYITNSEENKELILIFDEKVEDNYWNYAYLKSPSIDLAKVESYFAEKNINPSVYFLEKAEFAEIKRTLKENGYSISYRDAIMVFNQQEIDSSIRTVKVENANDEAAFMDVYKEVFCDEGEDVYSGLSEGYLENVKEYLRDYSKDARYDVVVYVESEPAGIASVLFDKKYALIMNVAVKNKFRNKGIAKGITKDCVEKFNNKIVFLGTEKDSENEEIYKRLGFKTVAVGQCYRKG